MSPAAGLSAPARKLGLVSSWVKGRPVWCSWQVTRRCGGLCHFCEHRNEGGDPDLPLDACLKIVGQLNGLGSWIVSLTGGEPFLRPDLPEIVAALSGRHFALLTTHGWLVTEDNARAVWQAGLEGASVVFHDAQPGRHDELAGAAGAYDRAAQALATLAETRQRRSQQVNIKVGLAVEHIESLEGLLRLAAQAGASLTVEPGYPLPATGGRDAVRRLLDLRRRYPQLRSGTFFLGRLDAALSGGVAGCQAGRAFVNIDHRGRMSKCIEFSSASDHLADLTRDSLQDQLAHLRRVPADNSCQACWSASRGEIEGLYTVRGFLAALPVLVRS